MLQTVLLYLVTLAFLLLLLILALRYPVAVLPLAAYLGILFQTLTGRKRPPTRRNRPPKP